jgi:hypothetical protein
MLGHHGRRAAGSILRPARRQVQLTVDQPVAVSAGVGQVEGDLGVVDFVAGAGVLALHPTVAVRFLPSPVSSITSTASGPPRRSTR